jgi:hypothetical protein
MRYIFGGKNYYIAIPPPPQKALFSGGEINYIAISPPIQVRGENGSITPALISVISWLSFLLMEETVVPGENHRPVASQ